MSAGSDDILTELEHAPQKPRPRIESLADLIFGLALSVGAISLVSSPPTNVQAIYTDLETFGFSFLLLITLWLRYTRIMSVFPLESRRVLNLNILLLLCVSVEPFLFNIVRNTPAAVTDPRAYADASSTLYALDLAALFGILGGFTLTLASDERKLIPKELIRRYRLEGVSQVACGLIFVVSALPIFFTLEGGTGGPIRYYIWIIPLLLIWVSRRFERRLEDSGGEAPDGVQTSKL
ncbi:MAG: TMEM175 family protein [Thaumarchaeota archaeon]|nr:TMEM175 family protein [Nitrososphaerota archaeon]